MFIRHDSETAGLIRRRIDALCAKLDDLYEQLKQGNISPQELQQDYEKICQPEAIALAKAAQAYVPPSDPRWIDGVFTDMKTFEWGLLKPTQLLTISGLLRDLKSYVPE